MYKLPIPTTGKLTTSMISYDAKHPLPLYIYDCGALPDNRKKIPAITPDVEDCHLLCAIEPSDITEDGNVRQCTYYIYAKYSYFLDMPMYHCFRYVHYTDPNNYLSVSNENIDPHHEQMLPDFKTLFTGFQHLCKIISYGKFTFLYPYAPEYDECVGKIYLTYKENEDGENFIITTAEDLIDIDENDESEVAKLDKGVDFIAEAYDVNTAEATDMMYDHERDISFISFADDVDEFVALIEVSTASDGVPSLTRVRHVYVTPDLRNSGIARTILQNCTFSSISVISRSTLDQTLQDSGAEPIIGVYRIPKLTETNKEK